MYLNQSINSQVCKCCVIDTLCGWIFPDITPRRPPPFSWYRRLIGFSSFYQLQLTRTLLSFQLFHSLFYPTILFIFLGGRCYMKKRREKRCKTDRSHLYPFKMYQKTKMDPRLKTVLLSLDIPGLQQHDQCDGLHAFIMQGKPCCFCKPG